MGEWVPPELFKLAPPEPTEPKKRAAEVSPAFARMARYADDGLRLDYAASTDGGEPRPSPRPPSRRTAVRPAVQTHLDNGPMPAAHPTPPAVTHQPAPRGV